MKKLLIVSSLLLALSLKAQTNTPQNFYHTVISYFTEFNPNLTNAFAETKSVDLWTSVDSIQGNASSEAKLADALGLSYTFSKSHISLENVLRTSGIAGVVVSDQLGVGFSITHVDTRVTFYGDAGYTLENHSTLHNFKDNLYGELGVRVKKALTDNTYAGVGLGVRIPDASQVYQVLVGATF